MLRSTRRASLLSGSPSAKLESAESKRCRGHLGRSWKALIADAGPQEKRPNRRGRSQIAGLDCAGSAIKRFIGPLLGVPALLWTQADWLDGRVGGVLSGDTVSVAARLPFHDQPRHGIVDTSFRR